MPYVITDACIDVKDKSCLMACPVDCIYEGGRTLYIQPDECIDCGLCETVCPVAAIHAEVSARRLELMESMRELRTQAFRDGGADATRYEAMAGLRQQMFDVSRDGRSRIEAVLTPEQRAQWRPAWRGAPWRG